MDNQYFIKAGYEPNLQSATFDKDTDTQYWTPTRLDKSATFQHYVYMYCREVIRDRGFKSLLELGCGPAVKTHRLLAPLLERIVLVDQPSVGSLVRSILPNADFIATNLECPDVPSDEQFDVVMCADVVEHLVDPDPLMRLIRQRLKPGGLGIISTPERDIVRGTECCGSPNPAHIREWNRGEFAAYLKSHSYQIERHLLLPEARLTLIEHQISRALQTFLATPRWSGCQMAVVS